MWYMVYDLVYAVAAEGGGAMLPRANREGGAEKTEKNFLSAKH